MDITNSNRDKLSKLKDDLFKNSNYIKKNYESILDSLKSISTKYIVSTNNLNNFIIQDQFLTNCYEYFLSNPYLIFHPIKIINYCYLKKYNIQDKNNFEKDINNTLLNFYKEIFKNYLKEENIFEEGQDRIIDTYTYKQVIQFIIDFNIIDKNKFEFEILKNKNDNLHSINQSISKNQNQKLNDVSFNNFNSSNVNDMTRMFSNPGSSNKHISNCDVSNVPDNFDQNLSNKNKSYTNLTSNSNKSPTNLTSNSNKSLNNVPSNSNHSPTNIPSNLNHGLTNHDPTNVPSNLNHGLTNVPSNLNHCLTNVPSNLNHGPTNVPSNINHGFTNHVPTNVPGNLNHSPTNVPGNLNHSFTNHGPTNVPNNLNYGPLNNNLPYMPNYLPIRQNNFNQHVPNGQINFNNMILDRLNKISDDLDFIKSNITNKRSYDRPIASDIEHQSKRYKRVEDKHN